MTPCQHCGGERVPAPVRFSWSVRLGLVVLTFALAYFGVAPRMVGMLEGVRGGFSPAVPAALLTLVVGLLAFGAGFLRLTRPVCRGCDAVEPAWLFVPTRKRTEQPSTDAAVPAGTDRRSFLAAAGAVGASGVAVVAAGVGGVLTRNRRWQDVGRDIFFADVEETSPIQKAEWAGSKVQNYRRLGRTDVMVSDISLGSGQIKNKEVAIKALERGITYFDTSPDYSDTASERILGEAIREVGGRDNIFLASKFCTAQGHLPGDASVPEIMAAVEGSLQRLGTDRLDLIHIHSCDQVDRLMSPTTHEAFDRLREQGKARFLGFSCHSPNLENVARAAMDSGRFDVMMLAYHHGLFPGIAEIIDEAHGRDIGIVAMKTLKGAKGRNLPGFEDQNASYAQAAFRWVLSNPSVSCLVVSFYEPTHCDEYLYASGQKPLETDTALLTRYDRLASADYCRPHCGKCLDSCVQGLPVDTVLRYDMYFADYQGRQLMAQEKYARLSQVGLDASSCLTCPAPCAGACPYELPIRAKMVRAHERLISI